MTNADDFIRRWKGSGGAERANYQMFLSELAELIGCGKPEAAGPSDTENAYVFDRAVKDPVSGSTNYIDLYKRGCFVLEAKQGIDNKKKDKDARQQELISGETQPAQTKVGTAKRGTPQWAREMEKARRQAHRYARHLEATDGEGAPPFLIVADVGYVMELYSDFSGVGRNYTQFTDGMHYRIEIEDLRKQEVRDLLRDIWTNPHELDPAKRSARVTRKIADQLAALGRSFETQGHASDKVARFLMRCLFAMFAEDVELIPKDSFTRLLDSLRGNVRSVQPTLENLWSSMDKGGFSPVLRHDLLRFNGGLFAECEALPVNETQLSLLIGAAEANWRDVEPAIFGTLLERALSPKERHKLGAHYTPRAYVERLVTPTIVEPLREDWDAAKAAAFMLYEKDDAKAARETVRAFHRRLCDTRVLDPACGSGNFLYVAMEQMKRLEGEVLETLKEMGETQDRLALTGETVDPHQFLGIELNPWAAYVAELVLWIGYLQWHFRTFGKATPSEPVLKNFHNIENRDALLVLEGQRPRMDEHGRPVTRWDGETMKRHPVTGEMVPDAAAKVQVYDYEKAKIASWPDAEFIIGNPPFIGASRMRDALGDGYVETLWQTYKKMPQSADFVMYWWEKAALLVRGGKVRRFGFITTNSLRQTFNRRVLEPHLDDKKKPLSLLYAIPDHPWVDSGDGAAVRIAMTVAAAGRREGRLLTLAREEKQEREGEGRLVEFTERRGKVFVNLQTGADVASAFELQANSHLGHRGVQPIGTGFTISRSEAALLGYPDKTKIVKPYMNGADLVQTSRDAFIIDFFPMGEAQARALSPEAFQLVLDRVKPDRLINNRKSYRDKWWLFGENVHAMRDALSGTERFIASVRDGVHRTFVALDGRVLADAKLIVVALDDFSSLSVLSSKHHEVWSLRAGGWLGVGNTPTYNHSKCFNTFPFPECTPEQTARLRDLGERLDAHRKARQKEHPKLTLTNMYNVLERLRAIEASGSGEVLDGKDREIYDQGQIGILKDLHDQIDREVAEAYGWPVDLSDEEILERLVALNKERHREELNGHIRWLRPEYQNPTGAEGTSKAGKLELEDAVTADALFDWPKDLPTQMAFVRNVLADLGTASVEDVRKQFKRGQTKTIQERLDTLAMLGQAERLDDGRYVA